MYRHVAISLILGLLAGAVGGLASENIVHHLRGAGSPQIAVVDLKSIVTEHQQEIIKKFGNGELSEKDKKAVQEAADVFARQLTMALAQVSEKQILLVKEAVVGRSNDVTDQIRSIVNDSSKH